MTSTGLWSLKKWERRKKKRQTMQHLKASESCLGICNYYEWCLKCSQLDSSMNSKLKNSILKCCSYSFMHDNGFQCGGLFILIGDHNQFHFILFRWSLFSFFFLRISITAHLKYHFLLHSKTLTRPSNKMQLKTTRLLNENFIYCFSNDRFCFYYSLRKKERQNKKHMQQLNRLFYLISTHINSIFCIV